MNIAENTDCSFPQFLSVCTPFIPHNGVILNEYLAYEYNFFRYSLIVTNIDPTDRHIT